MRTAYFSSCGGGGGGVRLPNPLDADHSLWIQTPNWMQIPLVAGHVTCDASLEANPPVSRMTQRYKNITLPQT